MRRIEVPVPLWMPGKPFSFFRRKKKLSWKKKEEWFRNSKAALSIKRGQENPSPCI